MPKEEHLSSLYKPSNIDDLTIPPLNTPWQLLTNSPKEVIILGVSWRAHGLSRGTHTCSNSSSHASLKVPYRHFQKWVELRERSQTTKRPHSVGPFMAHFRKTQEVMTKSRQISGCLGLWVMGEGREGWQDTGSFCEADGYFRCSHRGSFKAVSITIIYQIYLEADM